MDAMRHHESRELHLLRQELLMLAIRIDQVKPGAGMEKAMVERLMEIKMEAKKGTTR